MNRTECVDLLYLVRRLWPTTTPLSEDDPTAALLVLGDTSAAAALEAVVRISKRGDTFPPPIGVIYSECQPVRQGPERIPFELLEEAVPVDHEKQLENLERLRQVTEAVKIGKVPPL